MKNTDFKNNEFQIMQDIWSAYKTYYEAPDIDSEKWWDDCLAAFTSVFNQHKTELAEDLMNAFFNDIVRRSKEAKWAKKRR